MNQAQAIPSEGRGKMKLPNFFIIGAPKCGTTSLARWLSDHPQIYFSPVKEPFYFAGDIYQKFKTWEEYQNLFAGATDAHLAVGEGSTTYLYSEVAVNKIEKKFDQPKYIIMIRNPVLMAQSLHQQQLISFNETIEDFETAWRLSPERSEGRLIPPGVKSGKMLDLQSVCKLGEQIEKVFQVVDRERVLVLDLDDMRIDPEQVYEETLRFLNVPTDNRTDFPVYNPSKRWRVSWAGKLYKKFSQAIVYLKFRKPIIKMKSLGVLGPLRMKLVKQQERDNIPDDLITELRLFYAEDVKKLSRLLNMDYYTKWKFLPADKSISNDQPE